MKRDTKEKKERELKDRVIIGLSDIYNGYFN